MSTPKLGTPAEEQAQSGWETVNTSAVPGTIEDIVIEEVVLQKDGNVVLRPVRTLPMERKTGGIGDIQESAKDIIAAQIFDDPAMNSRISGNITRSCDRGMLQYFAVTGSVAAAVAGDRVMIKRDTMESAYSCRPCKGTGHTKETCPTCKGTKIDIDGKNSCRSCQVLGYDREFKHACGYTICESCHGAGSPGGIVIPESAKSSPISGIVVSCGPHVKLYRLGDRVLHARYAGHTLDTPDGESYTTMHEGEVMQLLKEL